MARIVTFLALLSHLRLVRSNFRTCVPNTQFMLNDRICYCDGKGQWIEASCIYVGHRQLCQPGQVVWHGCSHCICQDNGQLLCNNLNCPTTPDETKSVIATKGINSIGHWCTPFRIYYIDCNICVCPESGRTANVQCVKDTSCTALRSPSLSDLSANNKNTCKPKVLYVFSCLQCLCSDDGFFFPSNCVETCQPDPTPTSSIRTCTPHSFYRNDCNVCLCPGDGTYSDVSCTKEICGGKYNFKGVQSITSEIKQCTAQQFTSPLCLYCHCNPEGTINQESCLKLDCLNTSYNEYHLREGTCTPGEMVPFCTECLCLRNGTTHQDYCTKGCSYYNKMQVLEMVFKDPKYQKLLDLDTLDKTANALTCKLNSIYIENDKYCLCPDTETKEKSCLVAVENRFNFANPASQLSFKEVRIDIDFKRPCTPSTFVDFECNTCFCSKNGTIDPNWCTFDDCEAKRLILENQKTQRLVPKNPSDTCTPGSITEVDCNFCICPDNGLFKDKVCTKHFCSDIESAGTKENFDCDPLEYYEVDCNQCSCPFDGVKNIAKCTKNVCDDNFLRSDTCVPGKLFSEECNICVCPPTGAKRDRICTTHDCKKADTTWKRIFKFSNSIIDEFSEGTASSKKLDMCFPGEEFIVDDHFCVCPEMGLLTYATCSDMVMEDELNKKDKNAEPTAELDPNFGISDSFASAREQQKSQQQQQNQLQYLHQQPQYELQNRQQQPQQQYIQQYQQYPQPQQQQTVIKQEYYSNTSTNAGVKCATGSLYIKGCQQCFCPLVGDIVEFCRTLNASQCNASAIISSPYLRSGSRSTLNSTLGQIGLSAHAHTHYRCDTSGIVKDACHVCECERDSVIREHCFSSSSAACAGVEPTFLRDKL